MDNGIFQQVDENLFDENGVHRDHQEFLRHAHMDIGIWKSLFKRIIASERTSSTGSEVLVTLPSHC